MTPLEREIVGLIEADGPLPLERFMSLCLSHPQHGYYTGRVPIGRAGDFVTAPDISQMYGELIGVWCVQAWSDMGRPDSVQVIELGPGRGTLIADLARACRAFPEFCAASRYHLVETSPLLKRMQREALGDSQASVCWHGHLSEVPDAPAIVIANEFLDALPVCQFELHGGRWAERAVGLDGQGALAPGLLPFVSALPGMEGFDTPCEGSVIELSPARERYVELIAQRSLRDPLYALIVDYGHTQTALGDTVQAVREHAYCGVLETPGECDLTAHVDFQAVNEAVRRAGACTFAILTQRRFLLQLGIEARARRLRRDAEAAAAEDVARALSRFVDCDQMGNLFKVCAISSPGLPAPYPFIAETA